MQDVFKNKKGEKNKKGKTATAAMDAGFENLLGEKWMNAEMLATVFLLSMQEFRMAG
jgi:hypothetical protein